jgi:hypothetical protein
MEPKESLLIVRIILDEKRLAQAMKYIYHCNSFSQSLCT